ncbi:MAG: mannosyltransferase [Leucobacter sp.]
MTTLTLIGEPFPEWEQEFQRAAARELTTAVANAAPRGCSARLLVARDGNKATFASPRVQVEAVPVKTSMMPLVWQAGASARPLDGEFVHSLTPMVPLRPRSEDDGTQTSVTVPHSVAWEAPELLGAGQARLYRMFVRRAVKFADVILTTSHATARVLHQHYGAGIPVQVLPMAPPSELLRPVDAADRRNHFGLPDRYSVTTATDTEHGRLDWLFQALRADPTLPPIVVLEGCDPTSLHAESSKNKESAKGKKEAVGSPAAREEQANVAGGAVAQPAPTVTTVRPATEHEGGTVPTDLLGRVHIVRPREMADIGAVFSGADLFVQPQSIHGSGYLPLASLAASVPILHAGCDSYEELALDAARAASDAAGFAAEFGRIMHNATELSHLRVLADDRSRAFSWESTAWELWELHANL